MNNIIVPDTNVIIPAIAVITTAPAAIKGRSGVIVPNAVIITPITANNATIVPAPKNTAPSLLKSSIFLHSYENKTIVPPIISSNAPIAIINAPPSAIFSEYFLSLPTL